MGLGKPDRRHTWWASAESFMRVYTRHTAAENESKYMLWLSYSAKVAKTCFKYILLYHKMLMLRTHNVYLGQHLSLVCWHAYP